MLDVGILGASGMIGMQMTRMFSQHTRVANLHPFSERLAGSSFSSLHPAFRDLRDLRFESPDTEALKKCDVVLMSVSDYAPYLDFLQAADHVRVIDAGSGFRPKPGEPGLSTLPEDDPAWQLQSRFASVVPEINPEALRGKSRIATQGCVSTAVALGVYPLLKHGMLSKLHVTIDAKVASSGSGSSSNGYSAKHYNRANGVKVYRLLDEHRHSAELRAYFLNVLGVDVSLDINVFSVDLVRGISAALYVELEPGISERQVRQAFNEAYSGQPLVRVLKLSAGDEKYPNPKWLCGTGLCEIGFKVDPERGRAVIITALDNLMKGGASQAIQIFNLLHGFGISEGIPATPAYP